jgi:hypothetical protein
LTHCKKSKTVRFWIITNDRDYCIKHENRFLLNSLLTRNLKDACGAEPEIHCFDDLSDGIIHFGKNAGVTAEKLPTELEAAEIKKEMEALPRLGWMPTADWTADDAVMEAILDTSDGGSARARRDRRLE